MTGKNAGKNIR